MVMNKRDQILLNKILENQEALAASIKEFRISAPDDLSSVHIMIRRGMVQTVGDIFELTVPMSQSVLVQLPLNHAIIKQFRNTASHRYGQITNTLAYACIVHCVERQLIKKVWELAEQSFSE